MSKFKGLSTTLLSLIAAAIMLALVHHFEAFWQPKQATITVLLYALLLITGVFSAQFNHSRIALLCGVWLLFLATSKGLLPGTSWLTAHHPWLILSGSTFCLLLVYLKDRGLLSVHGIARVIFIILCGALAYGWLSLSHMAATQLPKTPLTTALIPHLPLTLPIGVAAILILWRSVTQKCLTTAFVLVTFIIWHMQHYQVIELPWLIVISILTINYLLIVLINSYFLAYRDDLTSLPSRRALNQLALALGRKYVVAMADIDHFKKFNDTYGHDIGDQVLKLVAAKLAKVKGGGKVFRYGGEEFTIVFPRKNIEFSLAHLEQIRQEIADYKIVVRQPVRKTKQARKDKKTHLEKTVNVTISIGVAQREGKQTFEQALKEADLALYRAKKKGRNKVSE